MTKTTVTDAGKVSWESTDAIAVFDSGKTAPIKATIKSISSDGKTAIFSPVSEITSPVGAIYPYDANATVSGNIVSLPLKASQSGAFADANIAASKADGYNLSFQNATSVFKFRITDENVSSVKLSATGVGGTLNITLGNTISSTLSGTSTIDEITVSNITSGTDYYVTIAPKTYEDLQFTWYDNTGAECGSSSLEESTTVSAGTIYTWGELTEHQDEAEFVQFEDAAFKAYCVENFDSDGDGEISMTEALTVTEISVDTEIISSLAGIRSFANLTMLACHPSSGRYKNSKLTTLDVSKNTVLTELNCANNQLTTLDVSKNTVLTKLDCMGNQLTTLDVSKNTALTELYCTLNQFTTLDVSKNTALKNLNCQGNQLTTLDVSKNTALTELDCNNNPLTSLNVSGCTALKKLNCQGDQLSTLDVSKNTALTMLFCNNNPLTSLNVSGCTALTVLYCDTNQLSTLDMSKNTALTVLDCHNNQLSTLDVSKNTALTELYCTFNQFTTLDVSKNMALTKLHCGNNQLSTLDVSKNTALTMLFCEDNQLTTLDLSYNTLLTRFSCMGNQIPYIYVWNGFNESEHSSWYKESSSEYVVKGAGAGGIEDYSVIDIWGNSGSTPGGNENPTDTDI